MAYKPIACKHCGKMFTPKNNLQKYCSGECYYAEAKHRQTESYKKLDIPERECVVCGRKFTPLYSQKTIFCTDVCKRKRQLEQQKESRERAKTNALEKKKKMSALAEMNAKARELNMSFGQYDLYLRMQNSARTSQTVHS